MDTMLAIDITSSDWITLLIQLLVTAGAVFGGAGFWQWMQSKDQAKRDAKSKESGVEKKVDDLTDTVTDLNQKFDTISVDMKSIRQDIELLKKADEVTKECIISREKQDKAAMEARQAIIESLTGLLRDRLLEAYKRCMKKGYYTAAERETYGALFKCYESEPFRGDGVMHDLQPIIKKLPWTAEEAGVDSEDIDV